MKPDDDDLNIELIYIGLVESYIEVENQESALKIAIKG